MTEKTKKALKLPEAGQWPDRITPTVLVAGAVLFVPLIFPLLYACASATTAVVVGAEGYLDVFTQSMALAGGYDVIMLLVSWVLYDFVISA